MSRVQLALNVDHLDTAVTFYSKLFGTAPAKLRPGYANFAVRNPPLKLVLLENPGHGGTLNHLGVEVESTHEVDAEQGRLASVGLASVDERGSTCCYAEQDKFWVDGAPDGERWEIYTVLADSPSFFDEDRESAVACCEPPAGFGRLSTFSPDQLAKRGPARGVSPAEHLRTRSGRQTRSS